MLAPFPSFPSGNPLSHPLSYPPTHTSPPWHSPTLGHQAFTEPRLSPPIDIKQGHPLLHMCLEPWVPPCVLFGWCFSPWELWGVWLVDIAVLPMGMQTLSAPSVRSLTPPNSFSLEFVIQDDSPQLPAISTISTICFHASLPGKILNPLKI